MRNLAVGLAMLAVAAAGCTPTSQAEGQVPLSKFDDRQWRFRPMNSGPGVWTACVEGNRLYLMDSYLDRAQDFHGTSPKTLAVAKGCN